MNNTANEATVNPVPMSCSTPICSSTLHARSGSLNQSPCLTNISSIPQPVVDGELVSLENRLVFPSHISGMDIAVPGRHIIFTSHLLIAEDNKWNKVCKWLYKFKFVP